MYCPECATQNLEAAKFCRVCGTNLEVISLALRGNPQTQVNQAKTEEQGLVKNSDWVRKKAQGTRSVVQGSVLLGVSSLIGLLGLIVSRGKFVWFPIWTVFFGWMACWGAIALAMGLSRLSESKVMLQAFNSVSRGTIEPQAITGGAADLSIPPSVTEHTTRQLKQTHK